MYVVSSFSLRLSNFFYSAGWGGGERERGRDTRTIIDDEMLIPREGDEFFSSYNPPV